MRCEAVGIRFLWHSAAPPGQDGKVKTFSFPPKSVITLINLNCLLTLSANVYEVLCFVISCPLPPLRAKLNIHGHGSCSSFSCSHPVVTKLVELRGARKIR